MYGHIFVPSRNDLGFEKHESSFEDLVKTVKTRFRYPGSGVPPSKYKMYNEVKKPSSTEKRRLALEY